MNNANIQQPQIKLNPDDLQDVVCEECGNNTFETSFFIKKISALVSPNGQESYIPAQVFSCKNCGHVNEEFKLRNA